MDIRLKKDIEEIETYFSLVDEDPELIGELEEEILKFSEFVEKVEIKNYLSGKHDSNNAFLNIHPGAGGTESQDWAEMLLRMYLRFGERMDFKTEIVDILLCFCCSY